MNIYNVILQNKSTNNINIYLIRKYNYNLQQFLSVHFLYLDMS